MIMIYTVEIPMKSMRIGQSQTLIILCCDQFTSHNILFQSRENHVPLLCPFSLFNGENQKKQHSRTINKQPGNQIPHSRKETLNKNIVHHKRTLYIVKFDLLLLLRGSITQNSIWSLTLETLSTLRPTSMLKLLLW
mgnify:CR=1 FL=1